jgi:hypothetical protein
MTEEKQDQFYEQLEQLQVGTENLQKYVIK